MPRLALVSQIKAAMTATAVVFAGLLFVDNTNLIMFSDSEVESSTMIMEHMQHAILDWQGGLQAMGGALQPDKCSWSLADFVWECGKWRYATAADSPGVLHLLDLTGMMQTLTHLESSELVKVMGVHQVLDGNMTAQFEALQQKADKWGGKLCSRWLPRHLAHHTLTTTIWASLRHPLLACTLSDKQGPLITKRLYTSLLPKMGANHNFPLVYHHAPASSKAWVSHNFTLNS